MTFGSRIALGFRVGGLFGLLQFARAGMESSTLTAGAQLWTLTVSWLLYGAVGALAVALVGLPAGRLLNRNGPVWRPLWWGGATAVCLIACGTFVLSRPSAEHGVPPGPLLAFYAAVAASWLPVVRSSPRRFWRLALLLALALLPPVALLAARGERAASGHRPNVLLISVDTLRADHLGCYGSPGVHTPRLDGLAGAGVLFEQAVSPMPITYPTHTTMLTGLYPAHHGVTLNRRQRLASEVVTLPERLEHHGYRTAAFVGGWALQRSLSRLEGRFQLYDDDFSPWAAVPDAVLRTGLAKLLLPAQRRVWSERPADRTVDAARSWLSRNGDDPFFLFVHLYDPHGPYHPPAPFDTMYDPDYDGPTDGDWYALSSAEREAILARRQDVEHMKALYAGEVSFVDREVGRLLDVLDRFGLNERTLVIFTSDHGESLTEHDYYFDHSVCLYEPSLRVPLIMRFPHGTGAGTRVSTLVGLTDLVPTVLEQLGLGAVAGLDGRSLLPLVAGESQQNGKPPLVVSALFRGEIHGDKSLLSLRSETHKYIRTSAWWGDLRRIPPSEELYDLVEDPGETQDLLDNHPELAKRYRQLAEPYWRNWLADRKPRALEMSKEDLEVLRSLGYLQ